jgi:SAM-dependent methyltransferase
MFFPERIKGIKENDKVLEIGPGATPFLRANVLLEMRYSSEAEYHRQCGGIGSSGVDKRTVFYDGEKFPFGDKEFDYAICSHVLEHVDDVEAICAEIFRVARAGYIEYPLYYYEYVYDIPEHVNVLKLVDGWLVYARKKDILPEESRAVRQFWFETLSDGYTETVSKLVPLIMEGFEWFEPFGVRKAINTEELCHKNVVLKEIRAHRIGNPAGHMETGAMFQKIKWLARKLVSFACRAIFKQASNQQGKN